MTKLGEEMGGEIQAHTPVSEFISNSETLHSLAVLRHSVLMIHFKSLLVEGP